MGRLSPLSGHLKRMRFGIGGTTLRVDRSSIMIRCSFVVIHEIEIHENATVFLKIRARRLCNYDLPYERCNQRMMFSPSNVSRTETPFAP